MDIAKIRKKAKEKEEKDRVSGEGPAEAESARHSPEPKEDTGSAEETVGTVFPEGPVGAEAAVIPDLEDEPLPSSPSVNKEGERGFSGEKGPQAPDHLLELLTFSISNEEFAFRVPEVEEIIRYQRITRVPAVAEYVRGITSLRGKIIPVLDLKKRLVLKREGSEMPQQTGGGKILILAGPKGLIGATIDKVLGVLRFTEGSILPPPGHLSDDELRFIEGVVILEKRFISIIRSYDALDIEFT
jgi:purine-binding chemotaxis protein CheW